MLKAGANDYLLKSSLARLGPAVERDLRDAEARYRQRRLEAALGVVAAAVTGPTGEAFLQSLVVQLARAVEADYVFIGELAGPEKTTVQTAAEFQRRSNAIS